MCALGSPVVTNSSGMSGVVNNSSLDTVQNNGGFLAYNATSMASNSRLAALTIMAGAIALGPSLEATQAGAQAVQNRSPAGVEYRSLPDTDAVKTARAALDKDPKNI